MTDPNEILDACTHISQEAHDENGVALPGVCRLCTGKVLAVAEKAIAAAVQAEREECAASADAFLHIITAEERQAGTHAAYSNGTVERIAAAIRARGPGGGR